MTGQRLLLMDDDEAVRVLTERMAGKIGWRMVTTADADQAMAAFTAARSAGEPFDAVILDVSIPGGPGGVEVLAELRRIEPDVVAVVTSGWSEDGVLARWGEHGFAAALPKPYTVADLQAAIHRALG
jgi:CheY-like chemotaxis protein